MSLIEGNCYCSRMKFSSVVADASAEFVLGPHFSRGRAAGRVSRPLGNLVGLGQGRDSSVHVLMCFDSRKCFSS